MKKIMTFAACLLLAASALAQNQSNRNAKLNLVVGKFSGDYSAEQRVNVIRTLTLSHRANVIEQSAYESLPQEVRSKMTIDAVITGNCAMSTERQESTRTDKNGNKRTVVTYASKMATTLTFTNPVNNTAALTPVFEATATDEDRDKSIQSAIAVGQTKGKKINFLLVQTLDLDEYLQEAFPMRGTIVTVNEQKKNEAKSVSINLGGRDAVYRGQTFEIVASKNGKEKNYGKLRVREINSDSLSTCSVEKGGKDIMKALEEGSELRVVSYVQAVSLNGLVRVEQEAPRLNMTSIDDSKKRNLALGSITGNANSNFVNALQQQLKENRRVNAYQLGQAGCPSLDNLDGIACGYFTGMKSSSRLVKAEDHLLQLKDYTEYSTTVGWYLFIVDPKTGDIVYAGSQGSTATSDKSADEATASAIRSAANITTATYSAYPLIGTILTVDDGNEKKAQKVTIDLGRDYPVYKGLRFDVYSQDANNDWEKIGRIEVADVVDGGHAQCDVKKGGEAIRKSIEEGLPMRITTYILKEHFDL